MKSFKSRSSETHIHVWHQCPLQHRICTLPTIYSLNLKSIQYTIVHSYLFCIHDRSHSHRQRLVWHFAHVTAKETSICVNRVYRECLDARARNETRAGLVESDMTVGADTWLRKKQLVSLSLFIILTIIIVMLTVKEPQLETGSFEALRPSASIWLFWCRTHFSHEVGTSLSGVCRFWIYPSGWSFRS